MATRSAGALGRPAIWITFLLCVGLTGAALANIDAFRYASVGNSNHCFYQLSARLTEARTLVLGSSRMRRGLDPDELGRLLGEGAGGVVNFGMPGRHTARSYLLLRDIVAETAEPPRRLIVEANLALWQRAGAPAYANYDYRPDFAAFASIGEVVEDARSKQGQPLLLRVRDVADQLLTKLDVALGSIAKARIAATLFHPWDGMDKTRRNICWPLAYDRPDQPPDLAELDAAKAAFFGSHRDWFDPGYGDVPRLFDDLSFSRELFYMRSIVSLAIKHGIAVYFTAVPTYYTWPPSPEFLVRFEAEVGAPLLIPDKVLSKRLIDAGYLDEGHLLSEARGLYTHFVADAIASGR